MLYVSYVRQLHEGRGDVGFWEAGVFLVKACGGR